MLGGLRGSRQVLENLSLMLLSVDTMKDSHEGMMISCGERGGCEAWGGTSMMITA